MTKEKEKARILDRITLSATLTISIIAAYEKGQEDAKNNLCHEGPQNLGQVMNEVALRGDDYIIERAGKPLVAIIPIEKYQKLQRDREDFYGMVQQFQESARNVDPKELDEAIDEAMERAKKETAAKIKARQTQ